MCSSGAGRGSLRMVLEGEVAAEGNQVVQRKAVLLVASRPVSVSSER